MMIQSIESTSWESAEEFCKKDMVAVLLIIMIFLCGWLPMALGAAALAAALVYFLLT